MKTKENIPCPVRGILDHVGDKWSVLVVMQLSMQNPSPLRFSELKRRVNGISQRMLTETLRDLERNGVVTRTMYATIPPKVEYNLTPLGLSFVGLVHPLVSWAKEHQSEIFAARHTFDTQLTEGNQSSTVRI